MIYVIEREVLITAFEHRYNRKPSNLELFVMNEHIQTHLAPVYELVNTALVEIEIEDKKVK